MNTTVKQKRSSISIIISRFFAFLQYNVLCKPNKRLWKEQLTSYIKYFKVFSEVFGKVSCLKVREAE